MSEKTSKKSSRFNDGERIYVNTSDTPPSGTDPNNPLHKIEEALWYLKLRKADIEHAFMALAVIQWLPEENDIKTMCVTLQGDGIVRMHLDKQFILDNDIETIAFGLAHEMQHVWYGQLRVPKSWNSDEHWMTACEIVVNDRVQKHINAGLPTFAGGGAPVDPKKFHKDFKSKVKGSNVDYEAFVATDEACANYLRQMPKPPNTSKMACPHANGSAGDAGDEDGTSSGSIDPEQAEQMSAEVLGNLIKRAADGDEDLKKTLLDLFDSNPDLPIWGNMPIGMLRGETTPTKKSTFWEMLLMNALASRLVPGDRPGYHRKIGFWYEPLAPVGKVAERNVSIYIDTSGSMGQDVIERIANLVGRIDGAEVKWNAFDADVYEFQPGDELRGGGGTSFDIVSSHVDQLDEAPDAVLIVTDGYAPEITPRFPESWVWVITKGGDTWPQRKGMETIEIDF